MHPSTKTLYERTTKYMPDCLVSQHHIEVAKHMFGPNLGSLKGKTTERKVKHVRSQVDPVPKQVLAEHCNVTLTVDIMFVNKQGFFITFSRTIFLGTIHALSNRQVDTITTALMGVSRVYQHQSFSITLIHADSEFEPIHEYLPQLQTADADDHVQEIEQYIRSMKYRVRSSYRMLPFSHVPQIILTHFVRNVIFWMNAFPSTQGGLGDNSSRYIMMGHPITYKAHVWCEIGQYTQTHEEHDQSMDEWTTGAICLGPTGNQSGGHYFMSLSTGSVIKRSRGTELPIPSDMIKRVNSMGTRQGIPRKLVFGDRHAKEIPDGLDDMGEWDDDTGDDTYTGSSSDDDNLEYDDDLSNDNNNTHYDGS